jgi:hypothetical protein
MLVVRARLLIKSMGCRPEDDELPDVFTFLRLHGCYCGGVGTARRQRVGILLPSRKMYEVSLFPALRRAFGRHLRT